MKNIKLHQWILDVFWHCFFDLRVNKMRLILLSILVLVVCMKNRSVVAEVRNKKLCERWASWKLLLLPSFVKSQLSWEKFALLSLLPLSKFVHHQ